MWNICHHHTDWFFNASQWPLERHTKWFGTPHVDFGRLEWQPLMLRANQPTVTNIVYDRPLVFGNQLLN